jgi:pimeloyl-ACP methyl ester carboxylesterase
MSELSIAVPGLTLAAKTWGDPAAEHKVLAIHGWLDNAATYDALAPLLRNIYLVAIDLPGHGLSQHRDANDTYHFIDWIPDVVAAADTLGFQRFTLMGHSMGAAVASITAGTVPERIRGLVLFDGIAPFTTTPAETPATLADYIRQRSRLLDKERPSCASFEAAMRRLQKVTNLEEPALKALVTRNTRQEGDRWVWTYDDRLRRISPMRFTEEHNMAFLQRIACPTLFVRPKDGFPVRPGLLEDWASAIKDMTTVRPEGGHHVHLEHADRIVDDVQRFLSDLVA